MNNVILVVGVPWSTHELAPAVRDAATLGAQVWVVDTPDMLMMIGPTIDIKKLSVSTLAANDVVAALEGFRPSCIVSLTEMAMECAASVREHLGYRGTSSESERAVSDKLETRHVLGRHHLTKVRWWEATVSNVRDVVVGLDFPLVLKPRALTGSTGVRLLNSLEDVENLDIQYAPEAKNSGRHQLLIETFVPGTEVSAEGIAVNGSFVLLTITDKVNTGAPYFYEVGHVMPSCYTEEWSWSVEQYLQRCIDALGIRTSAIHAELKISQETIELIELHSRYGGDNIVRLLEETFNLRPFEILFSAMLRERVPEKRCATDYWGIGFFTGVVGCPYRLSSLDFPNADAIVEIDIDIRRQAKLTQYEGVKLLYWRAGHALFASSKHERVHQNVQFMANRCAALKR